MRPLSDSPAFRSLSERLLARGYAKTAFCPDCVKLLGRFPHLHQCKTTPPAAVTGDEGPREEGPHAA